MKCASDYDNEDGTLLRQADECVEEWWETEKAKSEQTVSTGEEAKETVEAAAETEALRRGLLKRDEAGDVCLSCPEQQE